MTGSARGPAASPDFDIISQAGLHEPWSRFAAMRAASPIYWSEIQNGWMVTGHADVVAGFADIERLSSAMRTDVLRSDLYAEAARLNPLVFKHMPLTMNNLEGADHGRLRALMLKAFSKPMVERLRTVTAGVVDDVLDECARMGEFDFMPIGYRLPGLVTSRILGLPEECCDQLCEMAALFVQFQGMTEPSLEVISELERTVRDFFVILSRLIEEIESTPKDERKSDLLAAFVDARDNQQRLSHEEIQTACILLVAGGFDSTAAATAIFMKWICDRPQLLAFVRESERNTDQALAELWRYPGITLTQARIVSSDFEWHDSLLKKGDLVHLAIAAANTDPEVFPDPLEIDLTRKNLAQAKTFGHGAHLCVGQMLAKMEVQRFIWELYRRFDVEIVQRDFAYWPLHTLMRFKNLQVRFQPRRPAG